MKKAIYTALFVIVSGSALKVAAQEKNNSIGINVTYASGISDHMKSRIDSTVSATVKRFNAENHSFDINMNPERASDAITVNFTQGKLVTKKQRTTAYLVNLILPVYHPAHKISSTVSYPKKVSNDNAVAVNSRTTVLFANINAKEDKLLKKYGDRLYNELKGLDKAASLSKL